MEKILFYLGTGAYIFLGIIHLIGHGIVVFELQESLIGFGMKTFEVNIFGMKNSIMSFLNGFSVSMAFLMIVYGSMNLLIVKDKFRSSVYIFNALVSATFVLFSFFWFDKLLVLLYSVLFLLFLWLLVFSLFFSHRKFR